MDAIGQQLKAARERKGVTASQAAAATHLKVQHVEALEHDDYSRMPVPTYAKGFLRIYAEYLGLDPAPLLREYTLRHTPAPAAQSTAPLGGSHTLPPGRPFKFPRFSLPALPAMSPNLLRLVAMGAITIIVAVLLVSAIRHGCQRTAAAPTKPPTVSATPTQPKAALPAQAKPAPWVIVNEPPPPYYQHPVGPTTPP